MEISGNHAQGLFPIRPAACRQCGKDKIRWCCGAGSNYRTNTDFSDSYGQKYCDMLQLSYDRENSRFSEASKYAI